MISSFKFVETKYIDYKKLKKYLAPADRTNQFANYGNAVKLLEERAKSLFNIHNNKAVIAVSSGTAALHAAGYLKKLVAKAANQEVEFSSCSFTFYAAKSGPYTDINLYDFSSKTHSLGYIQDDLDMCVKVDDRTNIVTNLFGLVTPVRNRHEDIIYDNATAPKTYRNNVNINNFGFASAISLHHTKPLGFGEGGLLIVDKTLEPWAREIINFNKAAPEYGNNYKMSELSAAGILQWWDSFDVECIEEKYRDRYFEVANYYIKSYGATPLFYELEKQESMRFLPSCLPLIFGELEAPEYLLDNTEVKKYYKPLDNSTRANLLYNRLLCLPLGD